MVGYQVSIPDRVLGIFRLEDKSQHVTFLLVSIPDRVLGVFRLCQSALKYAEVPEFQSLIGF